MGIGFDCCEAYEDILDEVSLENQNIKILNEKSEKSICKIVGSNGGIEKGFFCRIPFYNKENPLPVLITNNTIINKDEIRSKNKNIIELIINNNNKQENKELLT